MTEASERQRTILVVEDHPDSRQLLCSLLRREDYNVIEAGNGKEGILQASQKHPDLIVMDLAMPGMDGIEATRRIRQVPKLANIPIFTVTAYATDSVKADVISAGCEEPLEKPIDIEVLLRKIKEKLSTAPIGRAVPEERRAQIYPRQVKRVETALPATWGFIPDGKFVGTITSLSVKGCLLETDLIVPLSERLIYIRFNLPTAGYLSLKGSVLYYLRKVGFGLGFTELKDKDRIILKQLVEYYSK